jgi:hypothetical protein
MGNGVWLLMPETVAAVAKDLIDNICVDGRGSPAEGAGRVP